MPTEKTAELQEIANELKGVKEELSRLNQTLADNNAAQKQGVATLTKALNEICSTIKDK